MATDGFSATINFAIRIPPICFGLQYVRRQTPPIELFFCVILLAGLLRLILHRDFKVALVLGVRMQRLSEGQMVQPTGTWLNDDMVGAFACPDGMQKIKRREVGSMSMICTPNTGCPVLGVHIRVSLTHFSIIPLSLISSLFCRILYLGISVPRIVLSTIAAS